MLGSPNLNELSPRINQTACTVRRVRWSLTSAPCNRCPRRARRVWDATRTAIDLDLDQPILLAIVVSVHHCRPCGHYFRAQPPFLRPEASYSNRVVLKAIQSVYEDGLAMRRVPPRLARDFWVRPSEKSIRLWCQAYAAGVDLTTNYEPWVVESFSGVLCVDEVYQGELALLLAVDPAAPDGDRLVGYQLVHGTVDGTMVGGFLRRLATAGIAPDQVITDGSALYPTLLAQVWPTAAHQLCLFHETRRVTTAVDEVAKAVRKTLPKPPPTTNRGLGGRPRVITPQPEATDAITERWRWREATRQAGIARVHALRSRGHSLRAIARATGFNRRTVTAWLQHEAPATAEAPDVRPGPPSPPRLVAGETPPPTPWARWEEVRHVQKALKRARPLLLRRPDHLTGEEQAQLEALLTSPIGSDLQVARRFLVDWYDLWRDDAGRRRAPADAWARYEAWHDQPDYARLSPLRRVQQSVDAARFAKLSQFLGESTWEATNNGAERMGRTFRHLSAPHFTLRTEASIDNALKVRAYLRKEAATVRDLVPASRSRRGRTKPEAAVARAA
jgi:hypothetical protein